MKTDPIQINELHKKEIDAMSYETLLYRNRFDPVGDPFWQGARGDYALEVLHKKKEALPEGRPAAISKRIGWNL